MRAMPYRTRRTSWMPGEMFSDSGLRLVAGRV